MSNDTDTPKGDTTQHDEPTTTEAPPELDMVMVVRVFDPAGDPQFEIRKTGDIRITEISGVLEGGLRRWRQLST